jgi:succinyl-CoA synthetase alpha subunit
VTTQGLDIARSEFASKGHGTKFVALEKAGVTTVKSPADLGKTLAGLMK